VPQEHWVSGVVDVQFPVRELYVASLGLPIALLEDWEWYASEAEFLELVLRLD
jgi:hypothetical protein